MAEETKCVAISAEFAADGITTSYTSCWQQSVPDGLWKASDVTTGLRKSLSTDARGWRTCQYFLKGLSAVCSSWSGKKCSMTDDIKPSGYNSGFCDFLGRREWCNKYNASKEDDLTEWVCIAPNPYLSGVTKRLEGAEPPILTAVSPEEILGYNAYGNNVGKCDCYGMGRGENGCGKAPEGGVGSAAAELELEKLPVVCNFYRPWHMGFGAVAPHSEKLKDGSPDLEAMLKLVETDAPYGFRMPLSYYVYNYRAKCQKCLWYDKDTGSDFIFNDRKFIILEEEANGNPFTNDKLDFCKCTDSAALEYNTRVKGADAPTNMVANIWAKAGTIICNGAKPECPCYSGQWLYNIDEKMWAGMPVTAQQILELRFWSNNWDSQEEYDEFFARKPNSTDPRTADIYTYTGWESISTTDHEGVMQGKKVHMCQPAPMQSNYFDPKLYITVTKITYASYGTTAGRQGQVTFANLIPVPTFPSKVDLFIAYPYFNDDSLDEAACSKGGKTDGLTKPTNETDFDHIYVVGQTLRNRTVFALNLTGIGDTPGSVAGKKNAFKMTDKEREKFNEEMNQFTADALETNLCYTGQTVSGNKTGVFITPKVKLKFGYNDILICVNWGGGWEFKKRRVNSLWCGGYIIQNEYIYEGPSSLPKSFQYQPYAIQPPPSVSANLVPAGGSGPGKSYAVRSYSRPDTGTQYHSWSLVEEEVDASGDDLKWFCIGNSYFIWCEINNKDVNHIFHWEIVQPQTNIDAVITYIGKKKDGKKPRAIPSSINMVRLTGIDQRCIPPNVVILSPAQPDNIRVKFISNEWSLNLKYKVQKMTESASGGSKVLAGAGLGTNNVYKAVEGLNTGESSVSAKTGKDTMAVLALFEAPVTGRAICAVATRLVAYITDVRCRSVDIKYSYSAAAKKFALIPNSGFSTHPSGDLPVGIVQHTSFPLCGDHECGDPCRGPMWYPYSACTDRDFYQVWAIAASCAQPHEGVIKRGKVVGRPDYRYMGPEDSIPYAEVYFALVNTCKIPYRYWNSVAAGVPTVFTGYANIKGKVDVKWYTANKWQLPPFGNDGRDLVERFMSQEYMYHYDLSNPPRVISEWVAMAMDHTAFFMSFNVFKDFRPNDGTPDDLDYSGADMSALTPFYFINQVNFMNYSTIGEMRDLSNRRDWGDIFSITSAAFAEYPPVARGETYPIVDFYRFKEKDTVWAWRDLPRAVDRGESSSQLNFVEDYRSPPYVFSFLKEEIRLVQSEGPFTVKYTGPTVAKGKVTKSPTICGRPFKILYGDSDEYSESDYGWEYIEWLNEGGSKDGTGAVVPGASSKKDNSYETCFGPSWVFGQTEYPEVFKNIIFTDAVPTKGTGPLKKDDPMNFISNIDGSEVTKLNYRRGLIVNITKDRLVYLPKDKTEIEVEISVPEMSEEDSEGLDVLGETSTFKGASFSCDLGVSDTTISRVVMKGKWGRILIPAKEAKTNEDGSVQPATSPTVKAFIKPGLSISGKIAGGAVYTPRGVPPLSPVLPDFGNVLNEYLISFDLPTSPVEMVKKVLQSATAVITGSPYGYVNISSLTVTTVKYSGGAQELIHVWERKYIVSKAFNLSGDAVINPDYTDTKLEGINNGGLHFNFDSFPDKMFRAENKIRGSFSSSTLYTIGNDKPLSITMGNLKIIESKEQRKLYDDAIKFDTNCMNKDYLTSPVPSLVRVAESNNIQNINSFGSSSCSFSGGPLLFNSHPRTLGFKQYPFWRLGGHKFVWAGGVERQNCMTGGGLEDIYKTSFEHLKHGGSTEVVPAIISYYQSRFYYQVARMNTYELLWGSPPPASIANDILGAANIYGSREYVPPGTRT